MRSQIKLAVLLATASLAEHAAVLPCHAGPTDEFELGLYLEAEHKESGVTTTSVKPRLAYDGGKVGTHISYETDDLIDGPDNDAIEWEIFARLGNGFKIQNEYEHEISSGLGASEFTVLQYFDLPSGFLIGYELEIDYFESNEMALHRVEIEPTIKWERDFWIGEFSSELEFPVMQLFDRGSRRTNFAIVSAQLGVEYAVEMHDNTQWEIELEVPYDLTNRTFELEITLGWERKF